MCSQFRYRRAVGIFCLTVFLVFVLEADGCSSPPQLVGLQITDLQIKTVIPTEMQVNHSYVFKMSLISKATQGYLANISLEKSTVVSADPTPVGTPGVSLQDALGPGYEPYAIGGLSASSMATDSAAPAMQTLRQQEVDWSWNVTPNESGDQLITFSINLQWIKTQSGGASLPPITYEIGEVNINVSVADANTPVSTKAGSQTSLAPASPPTPASQSNGGIDIWGSDVTTGQVNLGSCVTSIFAGLIVTATAEGVRNRRAKKKRKHTRASPSKPPSSHSVGRRTKASAKLEHAKRAALPAQEDRVGVVTDAAANPGSRDAEANVAGPRKFSRAEVLRLWRELRAGQHGVANVNVPHEPGDSE